MQQSGRPDSHIDILLIEDDHEEALIVRKMLSEKSGTGMTPALKVTHVDRLLTGIEHLSENKPDIIILDLGLPESQGLETLQMVRARVPDIPIMVLTGLDDEEVGFKAVQEGAQDYQIKGRTDNALLIRSIFYAIERSKLRDALEEKSNALEEKSKVLAENAKALEASAERFSRMVEDNADGIVIVDQNDTVLFANPATASLFENSRSRIEGKEFGFTVSPGEKREITIPRRGGKDLTGEMQVAKITWKKKPAYLVSIRDITELRNLISEKESLLLQMQENIKELEDSRLLRKRYLTFIVHELKRPLRAVYDVVCGLSRKKLTDSEKASMIKNIDRNVCSMMEMVTHILTLEHAKLLEQIGDFSEIAVRPLVEAVKSNFSRELSTKSIKFTIEINSGLVVTADLEKLTLIFFNIISNAVNFTSSGQIAVTGDYVGDNVQFNIQDTGRGITTPEQTMIKQVLKKKNRMSIRSDGTGVGLVVAHDLIVLHGGSLWFESERGKGSNFHFTIPFRYFLIKREETTALVQFAGSTLTSHQKAFKSMMTKLVEKGMKEITLDLKRVLNMGSLDISVLFGLYRIVNTADGVLKLKNTSWQVRELLKLTKLDQVMEVLT